MHFVVKYFPEITIKSPPVRKRFVRQLQTNLRRLLKPVSPGIEVVKGWDKLEIFSKNHDRAEIDRIADVLASTPGIAHFSESTTFEFDSLEDLAAKVKDIWLPMIEGKSFSVRARRQGKQSFGSMDVERLVGSVLNRGCESASVNLSNPDIVVKLEIVDSECFVLINQKQGLGGYPLGTQDDVLSLVSGGFDSTVASYLTNKRGLITHFCFFNLGGRSHELGVKEVSYYLWQKYASSHNVKFISVPFEGVVAEILENVSNSQMGVVLKRMMLRVATKVAADFGIQALVTGEAIAQVSSQTLTNLSVIDSVTETLVLRPLITMDKGDIINVSRQIGTEEFAANMPEYCGVISVKPTTRATRERIESEEANFNWDVLESAYQSSKAVSISAVANDLEEDLAEVQETSLVGNAIVIDIRHPTEEENQPLSLGSSTLKKIPFYQLNTRFPSLEKGTQYLLYCDRGVMSKLHAAHLKDAGFANVGVYRPES
ncbi:MAG: tRNA 4-thiouridine(8) synthase ThiI [Cellvibrionaceae bacterium]